MFIYWLVACAVCVGSGRARDEGWGDWWGVGGLWGSVHWYGAIAIDAGRLFHWTTVQMKRSIN